MLPLIITAGILFLIWLVVGTALFLDCEDLPYAWPYFAIKHLLQYVPGFRGRLRRKEAYRQGKYDMRNFGSVNNAMNGRRSNQYMSHKNERIYDAYIQGGNDVLAEKAEEAAGISLAQLRKIALTKQDEARLVQIEAMKVARQEVLAAPTDKWQTEFERITK